MLEAVIFLEHGAQVFLYMRFTDAALPLGGMSS